MPAFCEADFASRAVRTLGYGVAVQSEAVLLHVNVAGAVMGAQGVLESLKLLTEDMTSVTWLASLVAVSCAYCYTLKGFQKFVCQIRIVISQGRLVHPLIFPISLCYTATERSTFCCSMAFSCQY